MYSRRRALFSAVFRKEGAFWQVFPERGWPLAPPCLRIHASWSSIMYALSSLRGVVPSLGIQRVWAMSR